MDKLKKYSVVQFIKENSFAAIPSTWIYEGHSGILNKCRWPPGTNILQLIKNPNSQPKANWKKLDIKLFRSFCSGKFLNIISTK
jgi:hypothetical protein